MYINLFANGTTFGAPCSSPPENFTVGERFGSKLYVGNRFITRVPVPAKTAFFAVPFLRGTVETKICYDLEFVDMIRITDIEMIHLHPKLRFIPAEIFSRCEQIPLKSLANRNVAVLVSDRKCQTLGDVGEQNRCQSFYSHKTATHSELYDEHIAELARLGFFRFQQGYGLVSDVTDPVFNVGFVHFWDIVTTCFDLAKFNGILQEYKHLINNDLLQCPIIEVGHRAQAAYVSSVYSPTTRNHLMIIRPANTKLPMLKGTELVETKYQAIIDQATAAGQAPSSESREFSKSLRVAKFFFAPYRRAITFCQLVIRGLSKYQNGPYTSLTFAIDKAISRLTFSENYMTDLSGLVRQTIIYDELEQIKNTNPVEKLNIRQQENRKLLINKEVELIKTAIQQAVLPEKPSCFPMFNLHSLIMTSLVELSIEMREHKQWEEKVFRDKITEWKTEAQTICAETDEVLCNLETMYSLKLMSTLISIEQECVTDDSDNY